MMYARIALTVALVMVLANTQHTAASSIKGYQPVRQRDDGSRSVRVSPANTIERPARVYGDAVQQQQAAVINSPVVEDYANDPSQGKASPVAALESTKRLYQEEMSRRQQLAQMHQQQLASIRPVDEMKREKVITSPAGAPSEEPIARDGAAINEGPIKIEQKSQQQQQQVPVQAQFASAVPAVVMSSEPAIVPVAKVPVPQAASAPAVVVVPEAAAPAPAAQPVGASPVVPVEPIAKSSAAVEPAQVAAAPVMPASPTVAVVPAAAAPVVVVVAVPESSGVEQKKAPVGDEQQQQYYGAKSVEPVSSFEKLEPKKGSIAEEEKPAEAIVEAAKKQAESDDSKKFQQRSGAVPVPASQAAPAPAVVPASEVVAASAAAVEAKSGSEQQQQIVEDQLSAKKNAPGQEIYTPIEVPAPDPGLVLSEPIDSTTKLLINLDEDVAKFLSSDDVGSQAQSSVQAVQPVSGIDYASALASPSVGIEQSQPQQQQQVHPVAVKPSIYSSGDTEPIVPPLPSLVGAIVEQASGAVPASALNSPNVATNSDTDNGTPASRQGGNSGQSQQQVLGQLIDQLDALYARIQDTNNQLIARRRYVMSALLRPMGTYVRRVRTNLDRLQNRVMALQSAAVSIGSGGGAGGNGQRPNGFVDAAAIDAIRRRIDDISKRISDIVNRIRFSLTPTSAPLNNGR